MLTLVKLKFYIVDTFKFLRQVRGYNDMAIINFLNTFIRRVVELLKPVYKALDEGGLCY